VRQDYRGSTESVSVASTCPAPLRVALVAPPWYAVPPDGYGGVERVVFLLARGLQRRGHHVVVFGREGTDVGDEVYALAPAAWEADVGDWIHKEAFLARVYRVLRARSFDVVHDHSGTEGILLAATVPLGCAAFATVHGPIDARQDCFLSEVDDSVDLVAVSEAQRRQARHVRWSGTVHNAIDEGELVSDLPQKHDYLVQLARIHPVKGQHVAIEVARRVGLPLVLAGPVEQLPGVAEYFTEMIAPALGRGVSWIGDVPRRAKGVLLAGARAMLCPLQWSEPFGLAAVEAMANGTPVVAFPVGAMPEVIDEGVTGYLAADIDDMVRLVPVAAHLDPGACSARARSRFASARLAVRYERLYFAGRRRRGSADDHRQYHAFS
jgi:glycosyltransferase involved in cell wall biosynthesis